MRKRLIGKAVSSLIAQLIAGDGGIDILKMIIADQSPFAAIVDFQDPFVSRAR